jgi:hypothetical protein
VCRIKAKTGLWGEGVCRGCNSLAVAALVGGIVKIALAVSAPPLMGAILAMAAVWVTLTRGQSGFRFGVWVG